MSRRDAIDSLFLKKNPQPQTSAAKSPDRVRTGAISAMGASLQELAENAKEANQLRQQLAGGESVVSIRPEKIDPSPVRDRIVSDVDPAFDELVRSISENGQQVPILVRPLEGQPGRFQIAYGRRRLKAAGVLGIHVSAIVRELTDEQLVIAQGRENLDRKDLSFIEKAFFAKNLEDNGCERATIVAALGSDKGDVSRYISVARQIPEDLVLLIGPAPKAGRARWTSFAEKISSKDVAMRIRVMLSDAKMKVLDSDARFVAIIAESEAPLVNKRVLSADVWSTPSGRLGARVESKQGKTIIAFDEKSVPEFARFVAARLGPLYSDFENEKKGN